VVALLLAWSFRHARADSNESVGHPFFTHLAT